MGSTSVRRRLISAYSQFSRDCPATADEGQRATVCLIKVVWIMVLGAATYALLPAPRHRETCQSAPATLPTSELSIPKEYAESNRERQRRTEKGATLPRRSFAPACLQAAICTVILQLHVRQVAPWISLPLVGAAVRRRPANLDCQALRIDSSAPSSLADEPMRFSMDFNYRSSGYHARLATTRGSLRDSDNSLSPPLADTRPWRWRVHT